MRFPVLVNWHCALSHANQPKIQKLEETWCVKITSNRTWPFFSAVTLLHPLPFKNSRSHKNCDFDSETFWAADTPFVIKVWSKVLRDSIRRLPDVTI